ncbi:MAG: excinuclease ABC subunit UvrC [Firmicutes bacterium]|nr:excinuclease ABC subunit UvrC [Bacillota bacterium]
MANDIERLLDELPTEPGVYIMRDADGQVIYVGKAVNLRNRVRSYFRSSGQRSPKVAQLAAKVHDIDYIVTGSELEALVLECNLIKEHRPRYNVRLRDDKTYPFIRVTVNEAFPRAFLTRRVVKDGSRYFGPYTDVAAARETLRLLARVFPLRQCRMEINPDDPLRRPCLNYHIKRCLGPCAHAVSVEDYAEIVQGVVMFLEGKQDRLFKSIERRMNAAAENLNFEHAAALRDQLRALSRVAQQQNVVSDSFVDRDVIGLARDQWGACVRVLMVRDGKLVGAEHFMLGGTDDADEGEVLSAFVKEFYSGGAAVPVEVLLQVPIDDADVVRQWLSGLRGSKVRVITPQRGERRRLVDLAAENAREYLERERAVEQRELRARLDALSQLADALDLPGPPARIECYDMSNLQGTDAVGSMVVFEEGKPAKSQYRRFRIRTVQGQNDFAMMGEVLKRRFSRHREGDSRFARMPDLVLVDGGKGQLNVAVEVLTELGYGDVPMAGLAERYEHIYLPGRPQPLELPCDSPALLLLEHVRDEAHRFAVSHHRTLRGRRGISSELQNVPGVGKKRLVALMKAFGSLEALSQATVEEIAAVPGMNRPAAQAVFAHLHPPEAGNPQDREDGNDSKR